MMDEVRALHALIAELSASLSVTGVVEKAVAQTAAALDPDAVLLYLKEDDALHLHGHWGRAGLDPSIAPLLADAGARLGKAALRDDRPLYSRDARADALGTREGRQGAGVLAIAALPLGGRDGALGVLSLASLTDRDFAAHRPLLEILAGQVSLALQNARLHEQLRRHAETTRAELDAREKLEARLRQSEERHRALVDDVPAMICRFLPDGTLTFVNATYCSYFGRKREELTGQNLFQFIPERDRESVRRHYLSLTPDNPMVTYRHQVIRPDGGIAWQEWTDRALFDAGDAAAEYQSIGRDVTELVRTELALRQSEEMFRSVVQSAEAVIFVLDRDGIFRLSEGCGLSKLGLKPGEVVGASVFDLYRDNPVVVESVRKALAGSHTRAVVEARGLTFDVAYSPYRVSEGCVEGVVGLAIDMSKEAAAEKALRESERRFREVLERLPLISLILDVGGTIRFCNDHFVHLSGWSRHEILGANWFQRFTPGDTFLSANCEELGREDAIPAVQENAIVLRSGEERLVLWTNVAIRDAGGRVEGVARIGVDVTERRRADDALRESESRFRTLSTLAPVGIFLTDKEGDNIYINPRWEELTGQSARDCLGRGWSSVIHPDDVSRITEAWAAALQARGPFVTETRLVRPDGEVRWASVRANPFFAARGGFDGYVGMVQDITASKNAERSLVEEKDFADAIIDSVPGIFYVYDRSGKLLRWNAMLERITGFTTEEVATKPALSFVAEDARLRAAAAIAEVFEKGSSSVEADLVGKDGQRVPFLLTGTRLTQGTETYLVGTGTDISALRTSTESLRVSEERLRLALEGTTDGIWDWNVATEEGYYSPRIYTMLGYEPGEFPASHESWTDLLHPDDRAEAEKAVQRHFAPGAPSFPIEVRMRAKTGEWRWIMARGSVVERDADGKPLRMAGSHTDITDRKLAEDRVAAALQEKEVLLKELHHRVKNNLQVIMSLLELQGSAVRDEAAAAAFEESRNRVRSMALLHERLYRSGDVSRVRMAGYVESLIDSMLNSFGVAGSVTASVDVGSLSLALDTAVPCGLIINELVTNCLKHAFPTGRGGSIRVTMEKGAQGKLVLRVKDDGVGLPSRRAGEAMTSLGLTIVETLVKQLGGTLEVKGDDGTEVTVVFPDAQIAPSGLPAEPETGLEGLPG